MENTILDGTNPDHSNKSPNKLKDIFIGIGSGIGYTILCVLIVLGQNSSGFILPLILLFFYLAGIFIFFRVKRKYIAIGLLIILTILVFILGGCAILLSNLQIH